MAYLDLSHTALRTISPRTLFAIRLNHAQAMLIAAFVAAMTIVGIAAAMMRALL
jgi:hypothetical protein